MTDAHAAAFEHLSDTEKCVYLVGACVGLEYAYDVAKLAWDEGQKLDDGPAKATLLNLSSAFAKAMIAAHAKVKAMAEEMVRAAMRDTAPSQATVEKAKEADDA